MSILRTSIYGLLRSHQWDGLVLAQEIGSGQHPGRRIFTADVTPGGGKTKLYSIFAHELHGAGLVQQSLIVVPRDALRSQVQAGFTDISNNLPRRLRSNSKDERRGQSSLFERSGYVTTYQAVAANPRFYRKLVASMSTLLVLDEPHHLVVQPDPESDEDAAWWAAIAPLAEAAKLVLLGSGTLWRHDGQRIPLVTYDEGNRPVTDIRYTRRQALIEHAILPINFERIDSTAVYAHRNRVHEVDLSEANKAQQPKAIKTVLLSETRDEMAVECLRKWLDYRRTVYASRAIVICHSQDAAKSAARAAREALNIEVAVAISKDPKSQKTIKRFRDSSEGQVLFTVGMAYEGLDVPDCTHLICLTDVRSEPWLTQAFARVTRFDPKCGRRWDEQQAYVFTLDDHKMRAIIEKMMSEQTPALAELEKRGGTAPRRGPSSFRPIDAEKSGVRYSTMDGHFNDDECGQIDRVKRLLPYMAHHPLSEILDLARVIDWSKMPSDSKASGF